MLTGTLLAWLAAAACSSSGSPATPGSAGSPSSAGAGVAGASGGSAGASTTAGGSSVGGSSAGAAGATLGGGGAGGSSGGAAGAAGSGGQNSAGTAGSAGSAAGAAGAGNCTGRAVSLAANGTASDSDAAYSRVVIDLMSALPIGNSKRTVEFWAYIKSTDWVGDKNEIYYFGGSGSTATAFGMDFGTNTVAGMASNHATLNPFTDGGFNVDSTADLGITSSSNQWVHIAMTWDGTSLLTYVNGKLGITSTGMNNITMLATASGPLMIGCNPENKACFNGLFDEFSVWNVARSASEIMANYNRPRVGNEAGLVGYWKFDDAAGSTTAADSVTSGTAHPGTLMAAAAAQLPTFVTPPAPLPLVCP
ncbi:MAG: LamG domain-containing protein [Polyangiaceae bacterium]